MMRACLGALLSHWRRNPVQLFAYLAGLALATALWSGVQAINSEARNSYDAAAATLSEGQYDQLVARSGGAIPLATYVALRRSGWMVSPMIEAEVRGVRLIGVDPLTTPVSFGVGDTGAAPELDHLFANAATAGRLAGVAPVTVQETVGPNMAIGDIGLVQRLSGAAGLTRLFVLPDQPVTRPALQDVAPDLARQPSGQQADIGQLTDSFHLNLTAFGLLSFAVGLFIVHSTIGLAFEQRRGMIRTLRSIGVPLRGLVVLITAEMLFLALVGAALGVVLGYVIAALLLPDVAATLRGLYGAEVSGTLQLRAEWWLSGLALALLGTAAALAGRIWQVARMPVLASARPRAWVMATAARFRVQSAGAVALLAVAGVLFAVGDGLLAAFALLGCLLIGAALALPALAAVVLSGLQHRARGPVAMWFWADTRQQLPGLSLALMALLLAVSANIGVSTMVSSFRLTFVAFLDQRLAPELFVRVGSENESAALRQLLDARGLEVLPLMSTSTRVAGQPVQVYGIEVGPTYRENWAFVDAGADVWDRVQAGAAAVVNEQLARRANLWVGDRVTLSPDLSLPIAGVVGDYGNPLGQVVVAAPVYATLYPDDYPGQFGIRTSTPDTLRRAIMDGVGLPDSAIIDQAEIKALSLGVFERTFTVTAVLNVLTLGVAGFAILMSLLTLADLRVPQLAPVWALGLTRRTLGRLELARAVALAGIVFVCALPLGLALAWVLLSRVNVAAFGWQLPMFLFPADYGWLGAYALVAAALAAAWPAWRLMRTPPARLLKVFAHER